MKKIVQNNYKQIFLNVKVIDGTAILSGRVEKAEDKVEDVANDEATEKPVE